MELLSYPLLDVREESQIKDFLSDVTIIDLTQEIKRAAITVRCKYRLKLLNAVICATALTLNAELLSNDIKLTGIPDLSVKTLRLKNVRYEAWSGPESG